MRALSTVVEMLGRVFSMQSSGSPAPLPPQAVGATEYPFATASAEVAFDENSNEVLTVKLMVVESPDFAQTILVSPAAAAKLLEELTRCLSVKG